MPRHRGTHGEDAPAPDTTGEPCWEGDTENGEIVTLAGTPRRRSLHFDGGEGTNARAEDPRKKPALREPRDRPKRGNHYMWTESERAPRCRVGAQRGAGGKHWAHDRLALDCVLTWGYNPRSSGPSTPPASGHSTKSYDQGHPRTFHEEPGQRDCGAEGYQPGEHPASLQATFNSTGTSSRPKRRQQVTTKPKSKAKRRSKSPPKRTPKPTPPSSSSSSSSKYKYSDQEAKRSSLRTTSLGDTNAHWVGSFC